MNHDEQPQTKQIESRTMDSVQLRFQPPDVRVAVGRGDARQDFECYKAVLASASPYFDAMFCADMREKSSGFVEFPDKDPEEWKLFYQFVSPGQVLNVSEENVLTLAPWFHEFQMEACLGECDEIISTIVKKISKKKDSFWQNKGRGESALEERKVAFNRIIDLLCFTCKCDFEKSQGKAEFTLKHLMAKLHRETADLFNIGVIQKLLDLTLPLQGVTDENGKTFFRSKGKSTVFWDCVKEHVCDEELTPLLLEAVNDKTALTCLIHAYFRTFLKGEAKGEVKKHEILSATRIVNGLIKAAPEILHSRLSHLEGFGGFSGSDASNLRKARVYMDEIRDKTLAKQKELFDKLGIDVSDDD